MSEIFDTIVAGAGPGGATAALVLSEAGQRVLVLEKETFPRYKPCGGGLSAVSLDQFSFSFEPVIESNVKAIQYVLGDKSVTIPLVNNSLRMVMRDRFDDYLLQHVKAEICEASPVQKVEERADRVVIETATGSRVEGRYLIASDGANSIIAGTLGLRRNKLLAAAIEAEVPVPSDIWDRFAAQPMLVLGELHAGYIWVFPKVSHLSVGIGALHPQPGELQATLKRVMKRFDISLEGVALHGHTLPIYTKRDPIATNRTLLVGDAAGLVDPFTGEGIRFAMKSGRLAAESVLSGHVEEYSSLVNSQIGSHHRWGLALANLFYNLPGPCFELGVRNPFVTRALIDMLADRTDYKGVVLQMIGTLPLFFLTEAIASLGGVIAGPNFITTVRKMVYSI